AGADISLAPAIFADFARRFGERRVGRRDDSGIAQRTQIFRRIKAETGKIAKAAGRTAAINRTMTLRAILDDAQTLHAGDLANSSEIDRLAVKMHRQDGGGTARRRIAQRGVERG